MLGRGQQGSDARSAGGGSDSSGRKTPTQDDSQNIAAQVEGLSINIPAHDKTNHPDSMPKKKRNENRGTFHPVSAIASRRFRNAADLELRLCFSRGTL